MTGAEPNHDHAGAYYLSACESDDDYYQINLNERKD